MATDSQRKGRAPATLAAQALGQVDPATGALIPPLHWSATYERAADLSYPNGFVYGRHDNPTIRHAEDVISALEGGDHTLMFSSGMAAATTFFMSLERPGHLIVPQVMYWALREWLKTEALLAGFKVQFVDMGDTESVARAIVPGQTRAIWIETPANPLWTIADIAAMAALAKSAGAALAVDSTAASPVLTRPLGLGASVVMHAATKYLNGHSDVIAGALTFAADTPLAARARALRKSQGAILGPFEAAMLIRGMRTLFVRVERQCVSALAIARHFENDPRIHSVLYPGLPRHPGHAIAARQMANGFGGMLSIRVAAGREAAIAAAARVTVWTRATSLGGVESLIEHRASIEGPGSPCPSDLLRLSVGLEDPADLIADLDRALG